MKEAMKPLNCDVNWKQAVETALALWVAMQNPGVQMYDNTGLAKSLGPDV